MKIVLFAEISREYKNLKEEDFIEPPLEFSQSKHIFVAEMSENLKRLFTLWFKARYATRDFTEKFELAEIAADESEAESEVSKVKKAALEVNKAKEREQVLEGTFWYAVVMEHPDIDASLISVTKGFKVARAKE